MRQLTEQVPPPSLMQSCCSNEIRNAHPPDPCSNVLLQMMDDGRLTDGKGRVVDFTNTIIIMTSNLGSSYLQSGPCAHARKKFEKASENRVMSLLHTHFKPEFLNRVDDNPIVLRPAGQGATGEESSNLRLEDVRRLLADPQDLARVDGRQGTAVHAEATIRTSAPRPSLKARSRSRLQDPLAP